MNSIANEYFEHAKLCIESRMPKRFRGYSSWMFEDAAFYSMSENDAGSAAKCFYEASKAELTLGFYPRLPEYIEKISNMGFSESKKLEYLLDIAKRVNSNNQDMKKMNKRILQRLPDECKANLNQRMEEEAAYFYDERRYNPWIMKLYFNMKKIPFGNKIMRRCLKKSHPLAKELGEQYEKEYEAVSQNLSDSNEYYTLNSPSWPSLGGLLNRTEEI